MPVQQGVDRLQEVAGPIFCSFFSSFGCHSLDICRVLLRRCVGSEIECRKHNWGLEQCSEGPRGGWRPGIIVMFWSSAERLVGRWESRLSLSLLLSLSLPLSLLNVIPTPSLLTLLWCCFLFFIYSLIFLSFRLIINSSLSQLCTYII